MDTELKERHFLAQQESPGGWLLQALRLRAVAARIDWETHPPRDDEPTVSFLAEYYMLLGLAFENLLKGFISLVRLERQLLPPLPRECHVHRLEDLASRPECAELALSEAETGILARLSPFIEWAGRYPIPKRSSEMIPVHSSNREREEEQELWERLAPLLNERALVMKGGPECMGGYKLYMKRRTLTET